MTVKELNGQNAEKGNGGWGYNLQVRYKDENEQVVPNNPKDLIGAKKVDLSLIPGGALAHVALALMYGKTCYGPYNWREEGKKVGIMTYMGANKRHRDAFIDGEDHAQDSLVHHIAHAIASDLVVLDAILCGNCIDDRPLKGSASKVHAELADKLPELLKRWEQLKKDREVKKNDK